MEKIEVVINSDGTYSIHAKGFKGKTCVEKTKFLEELGTKTDTKKTPEFFLGDGDKQTHRW